MTTKIKPKELIKFFFSFQRKYQYLAVFAAIILLINVLLQLPMPLITRYLIDIIIPAKNFAALNFLSLGLFGIIIFRQAIGYLMEYLLAKYKAKVRFDLEQALYMHIQTLPLDYFNKKQSGYILSRISEVSSIESVMADTFLYILRDTLTIIVGAVLILSMHFQLGIISLLILPLFVYSLKFFHHKIKDINTILRESSAKYYGKVERNITAMEKIKSAVKEETEGRRLSEKLGTVINLGLKSELLNAFASTVTSFLGVIAPFIVLWYGVSSIMKGTLTLGTFFAINSFLGYLYKPASSLTSTGFSLSRAMAALERIYEIFHEPGENFEGEDIQSIESIQFKDVGFKYTSDQWALYDLNLTFKRGQKAAVVGESGQGKSTMIKMMLKFYLPQTGNILFSGKDAADISARSIRRKIAYVSQSLQLLEDEIEEKVNNPQVKEWLTLFRFDKNFNGPNGEAAAPGSQILQKSFSGGEVQKLEIIDTLLQDADVLIIDEGTSNVDYNAEKILLQELFRKYQDKIIIFIAHRLTTITDFDRIMVMDGGCIVEAGAHQELLDKQGKYHSSGENKRNNAPHSPKTVRKRISGLPNAFIA